MKKKLWKILNNKNIYSIDITCIKYLKNAINCSDCKMKPDIIMYVYGNSKFYIYCSCCSKCGNSAKTIKGAIKKWNKLNNKK